jgi:hypothetical protein
MLISVSDIILSVFVVGVLILAWYFIHGFLKYQNRKIDLTEYEININYDASNVSDELDAIIQGCIEEYSIINIHINDVQYINTELESKMREEISEEVSKKLSLAYIQKLSTFYSSSSIYDIIGKKIYLAVTAYTVEFNAGKPSKL